MVWILINIGAEHSKLIDFAKAGVCGLSVQMMPMRLSIVDDFNAAGLKTLS